MGTLDTIQYYSMVSKKLAGFLKNKPLATKTYFDGGLTVIKRGSQLQPLGAKELGECVNKTFLQTRSRTEHLKDAKGLSNAQKKAWQYFFPRKLNCLFYATNGEGVHQPIERLFFDIDRRNQSAENAQIAAKELAQCMLQDNAFKSRVGKFRIFPMWTGKSFHVYLLLDKSLQAGDYVKTIQFSKNDELATFTGRWARQIAQKTGLPVVGGHEKQEDKIILDPSQTMSGKLARAPFSLHMLDPQTVDGVAIPLTLQELNDRQLVKKMQSCTPDNVIKELNLLAKKLPY